MEVNCFINPPPLLHPYPSAGQSLHVFMLCALKSARCYTCARASFGKKENCLLPRPAKCLILSVMSATFITGWPYGVLVFKNESLKNLTLVLWHRPQGTQKNRRGGGVMWKWHGVLTESEKIMARVNLMRHPLSKSAFEWMLKRLSLSAAFSANAWMARQASSFFFFSPCWMLLHYPSPGLGIWVTGTSLKLTSWHICLNLGA